MRIQSDAEINDFLGVVNDKRFDSMCIRITTEVTPLVSNLFAGSSEPTTTEEDLDAELGRYNK